MAEEMFWLGFKFQVPNIDTGEHLVVIDERDLHEAAQGEYRMWMLMEHIDKLLAPADEKKSSLWRKLWSKKLP